MKRREIFEPIDPPPNGVAALRARLDARSRPLRVLVPAAAAVAIAAAIALILAGRRDVIDVAALARADGSPSEIGLGLAKPSAEPVTLVADQRGTTALAAVATTDPHVAFYWVSSTTWDGGEQR